MQCALLLVPVAALDLVLYHVMVVFCKVKQNEAWCVIHLSLSGLQIACLAFCNKGMRGEFVDLVH